jgi:hypothetical protein
VPLLLLLPLQPVLLLSLPLVAAHAFVRRERCSSPFEFFVRSLSLRNQM